MKKYSYIGQRYTQGDSPLELITFCAEASDVWRWGGVPSKNERFHGGFQRALNARYKKIINFFNNGQCSPGAVVVAFRKDILTVNNLGLPTSWPSPTTLTSQPEFVHLSFESSDDAKMSLEELIEQVKSLLEKRPGFPSVQDGEPTPGDGFEIPDSDEGEFGTDPEQSGTEDANGDDDIDVGQSKLRAFYDFINSPEAIKGWVEKQNEKIKKIKSKKNASASEKEFAQYTPEEKLKYTLRSLLRPAMIVDGQHRINGANESEKESIKFTICAIKDADWVEQVFQFVVLNKMAKPITKDFLTELLNTSLTNVEISDIDDRLDKIGIKNTDRKIHKFINHDSRSPFLGLVAEAGEVGGAENTGKMSQQGMLALAKRWRSIAGSGKTSEMNCFLPYLGVSTLTEGRKAWDNYENWMPLFFAFWSEIKAKYEPQHIWVKQEKYHLLYIVTLQALQDHFIDAKARGQVKFASMDDFRAQVRDFFANVPATFFQDWSATGLQSGTGWQDIKDAIEMFQNGFKLPKVQVESKLFQ